MARITDEQKIQINELYAKIKIKSRVAQELGISVASVSKYLIPNYIPIADRVQEEKFTQKPTGMNEDLFSMDKFSLAAAMIQLTDKEKEDLKELQKGLFI